MPPTITRLRLRRRTLREVRLVVRLAVRLPARLAPLLRPILDFPPSKNFQTAANERGSRPCASIPAL